MPTRKLQGFTHAYLASLFKYGPRTGLITRRVKRGCCLPGAVVGTVDGKGYLHVNVDGVFIRLHRLAYFLHWGWAPGIVDHKNNDKQDNRISNLRPACWKGNAGNARLQRNNTSGYRGVSLNARDQKWCAQIKLNGVQTYLGRFDTPEEAARCYDIAARRHFGEFAKLNRA